MLLPTDLESIVWRYKHELEFAPVMQQLRGTYLQHKANIDGMIDDDLPYMRPHRRVKFAPGGVLRERMISCWYRILFGTYYLT